MTDLSTDFFDTGNGGAGTNVINGIGNRGTERCLGFGGFFTEKSMIKSRTVIAINHSNAITATKASKQTNQSFGSSICVTPEYPRTRIV